MMKCRLTASAVLPGDSRHGAQHAKVTVSAARLCYLRNLSLSPGAFAINDLYPTAQSGDLEVRVKESDGSVRSLPNHTHGPLCSREGRSKFSLSAGRYHLSQHQVGSPQFVQGTLFYGLPAEFTLYGGTQLAQDYQAWALGIGRGFGELGSLGSDVTWPILRPLIDTTPDIHCASSIKRILPRRGPRSASPAIATPPAAIMASARLTPRKPERATGQQASTRRDPVAQSFGAVSSPAISAYSQTYWHSNSNDETVHLWFYSAWKGVG